MCKEAAVFRCRHCTVPSKVLLHVANELKTVQLQQLIFIMKISMKFTTFV